MPCPFPVLSRGRTEGRPQSEHPLPPSLPLPLLPRTIPGETSNQRTRPLRCSVCTCRGMAFLKKVWCMMHSCPSKSSFVSLQNHLKVVNQSKARFQLTFIWCRKKQSMLNITYIYATCNTTIFCNGPLIYVPRFQMRPRKQRGRKTSTASESTPPPSLLKVTLWPRPTILRDRKAVALGYPLIMDEHLQYLAWY